jgi:hypothetical protein
LLIELPRVYDRSLALPSFARALNELNEQFFFVVIEVARDVDLHRDVVITDAAGTVGDSLAAKS